MVVKMSFFHPGSLPSEFSTVNIYSIELIITAPDLIIILVPEHCFTRHELCSLAMTFLSC